MAQLYYKYGTMNSGKRLKFLKVAHNYEEQGKPVVIMTSSLDTRDEFGVISSRIGMRRKAIPITDDMDIFAYINSFKDKPYCVLIDECQFLSKKNVYDLARIVDELGVPVMAFGLKTISKIISLKVRANCCLWQIRSKKLRQSVNFVPKGDYGAENSGREACLRG